MAEILVTQRDDRRYAVTVTDGASATQHEVLVDASDLADLGVAGCDPRAVVEESFRFLLEREPKESILGSFDLPTITRFFPEFRADINRLMAEELDR